MNQSVNQSMNWIIKTENLHYKFPARRFQGGTLYYNNNNNNNNINNIDDAILDSPSALHIKQCECNSPELHLRTLQREVAQPRSVWRRKENITYECLKARKTGEVMFDPKAGGPSTASQHSRTNTWVLSEYMHQHAPASLCGHGVERFGTAV